MSVITLVAKGPSAAKAAEWIAECPGTEVATINDAAFLIPGVFIRFNFLTHARLFGAIESERHRIKAFVGPDYETHEGKAPPEWADLVYTYADRTCAGGPEDLLERIAEGGICHHNTTNGALHWLAKHGRYQTIRVIGVDGGRHYAPGVGVISDTMHKRIIQNEGTEDYLDLWKEVTHGLADLLQRVYGVKVVFHES